MNRQNCWHLTIIFWCITALYFCCSKYYFIFLMYLSHTFRHSSSIYNIKKSQTTPKQLNVASLINDPALQAQYNITIQNKFAVPGPLSDDVDTAWNSFSLTVTEAALETVGTRIHICKPWLSAAACTIIDQKAAARKRGDHAERNRLQRAFKTRPRRTTRLS